MKIKTKIKWKSKLKYFKNIEKLKKNQIKSNDKQKWKRFFLIKKSDLCHISVWDPESSDKIERNWNYSADFETKDN